MGVIVAEATRAAKRSGGVLLTTGMNDMMLMRLELRSSLAVSNKLRWMFVNYRPTRAGPFFLVP